MTYLNQTKEGVIETVETGTRMTPFASMWPYCAYAENELQIKIRNIETNWSKIVHFSTT